MIFDFLVVVLLRWVFDRFLIDFGWILGWKMDEKSITNQSKCNRKQDASWDGFWMALGSIFGWFWAQVGGQVGVKLAPKSEDMGYQDNVKKSSKIWGREGTQVVCSGMRVDLVLAPKESLWDPLILEYKSTRGKLSALGPLPIGHKARGRIFHDCRYKAHCSKSFS